MSNHRILLLMPIPFWHPGTLELIQRLKKSGHEVAALDLWELRYFDSAGMVHNLIPSFLKGFFARVYRRLFRKNCIRRYIKKGDIVDIQWCGHYYSPYMTSIKKRNVKIVATLFGSDLYRSSLDEKRKMVPIFQHADSIVMGVNMLPGFNAHFQGFDQKIRFAQYGSGRLDLIREMSSEINKSVFRKKWGIPQEKVVVTVGYNAKPEQQHIRFLKQIACLDTAIKEKMFLLFPFTYGANDNPAYFKELMKNIEEIDINYRCLHQRMPDDIYAETKVISDITVNLQTTDALASSIKEAMVSGDVLLVGDWLPYEVYEELGVFFFRSNVEEFADKLLEIINNMELYRSKCRQNPQAILAFASWNSVLPQFLKNYNELWQE